MKVLAGVLLVSGCSAGQNHITVQGHLRFPVGIRRVCHLDRGDQILLRALPDLGLLTVYTGHALESMVCLFDASICAEKA